MYVGCPMSVPDGDKVITQKQRENEKALLSDDIKVLVEVAKQPELSVRQVRYLARRCVDLAPQAPRDFGTMERLAASILQHPKCSIEAARILNESTLPQIWAVLAQSAWPDEEMAKELNDRATYLKYNSPQKNLALEIWGGLASSAALSGKTQDFLMDRGIDCLYEPLSRSVTLSGPRLLKLAKIVRNAFPEAVTGEKKILQALETHNNATAETLGIVQQIRQYDAWVAEAQADEVSIKRLVELSKACAGITDCRLRAYWLARVLVCHDKAAAEMMAELANSPYAFVWYLATRCELTDNATLQKIAQQTAAKAHDSCNKEPEELLQGIVCELLKHLNSSDAVVSELIQGDSSKEWFCLMVCRRAPYSRYAGINTLKILAQEAKKCHSKDREEILVGILGNPHLSEDANFKHECVAIWNSYMSHPEKEYFILPEMAQRWQCDRGEKLAFPESGVKLKIR